VIADEQPASEAAMLNTSGTAGGELSGTSEHPSSSPSPSPSSSSSSSSLTAKLINVRGAIELSFLFILALALRLLFNFVWPHVNNFAACDAFEYINNGQALLQVLAQPADFWQKSLTCLIGAGSAADLHLVKTALAPMQDFYISGPVFPAFLALIVALSGGTVANVHFLWQALLTGNSVVSALSCVFIALIASELFDRRAARFAGLIAAFYPGFVVNSGRLYSETFAAFVLVVLSYITVRGFRRAGNNYPLIFLSGFLAAALQLTRSVMAALTLALLPITALQQKGLRRVVFLLPFALGFALVALPWLGFQKLAFGGGGLVVDRVGHYNFFIGNNVDTQGWLSYPYPDGRNVDARTFPQLLQLSIKKSPSRWFRLMLDKPLRLFEFPWNDFRTAIGALEFRWQVYYHEALVLLAALGLVLGLFLAPKSAPERRQLLGRIYLAGLFFFHFVYCSFITVPRYNLTAMPELVVFAGAALALLHQLYRERGSRLRAVLLASTLIFFFALLNNNLLPYLSALGLSAERGWAIQASIRIVFLLVFLAISIKTITSLKGNTKLAIGLATLIAVASIPLLAIPLRANGRYTEWYQNLAASSAPLQQTISLPIDVCRRHPNSLFLLVDTEGVRQPVDGFQLSVNNMQLPGPVLPSMSFAENFDRFLELGPQSVQREGERMWDSLTNGAACGNLDLRQWSMIALPDTLVTDAVSKASCANSAQATFSVSVKNTSANPQRIYGAYDVNDKERLIPSIDVYSWEKVFYGVENPEGLTDTRYDIKVPASTLKPSQSDLSDLPGLQNGVLNMSILVAPDLAPASAAVASASATVTPANPPASSNPDRFTTGPMTVSKSGTVFKPGLVSKPGSVSKPVSAPSPSSKFPITSLTRIASYDLGSLKSNTVAGLNKNADLSKLPASTDSIYVLVLRGRSRLLSGAVCPAADLEAEYKNPKTGATFTYKSAWSPRRLVASKEWHNFEVVVPVKPTVENGKVIQASARLHITSPESPYENVQRNIDGECEFSSLTLDVYALPSNPIGLGHQIY